MKKIVVLLIVMLSVFYTGIQAADKAVNTQPGTAIQAEKTVKSKITATAATGAEKKTDQADSQKENDAKSFWKDRAVLAAIVGAVLGAIFGAVASFLGSRYLWKLEKEEKILLGRERRWNYLNDMRIEAKNNKKALGDFQKKVFGGGKGDLEGFDLKYIGAFEEQYNTVFNFSRESRERFLAFTGKMTGLKKPLAQERSERIKPDDFKEHNDNFEAFIRFLDEAEASDNDFRRKAGV